MRKEYLEHESTEKPNETVFVAVTEGYSRGVEGNGQEVVKKTEELANRALVEAEQFYRTALTNKISIGITDRDSMDKASGHKTQEWTVGLRTSKGLCLLDPRLYVNTAKENGYEPETDHIFEEDSYFKLIKHELGHEVFGKICNIPPSKLDFLRWFNEGTQFYMTGQLNNEAKNFDTDFLENEKTKDYYQKSAMVIKKLAEIYGEEGFKDGLLYILNSLGNTYPEITKDTSGLVSTKLKTVFERSFEEAFGIKPTSEGILEFMKLQDKSVSSEK